MQWSLDNLKDKQLWLRVGYTFLVLFVVCLVWDYILYFLIFTWLAQSVCLMFTGQVFEQGTSYARLINMTFYQYLEYLTYISSEKPYPFNHLP